MTTKYNRNNSLFGRAYVRDSVTNTTYTEDAMLIAVLTHTTANDRNGLHGKIVRKIMNDANEFED